MSVINGVPIGGAIYEYILSESPGAVSLPAAETLWENIMQAMLNNLATNSPGASLFLQIDSVGTGLQWTDVSSTGVVISASLPLSISSNDISLIYNSANLKLDSGSNLLDTIQNIGSGSTPSFKGVNLTTGGLADQYVTTAISLGDALDTSLITTNKTILGAINEVKAELNAIPNPLLFKGEISVNTDFPLIAAVQTGWTYIITASVTDNAGVLYTNTGQSFNKGDWIAFNGTNWSDAGTQLAFSYPLLNTSNAISLLYNSTFLKINGSNQLDVNVGNVSEATSDVLSFSGNTNAVFGSGLAITVAKASGSQDGYVSSTDWTTFNSKQAALSLTVTGSSGSATLISNVLNIPTYTLAGLGGISLSSLSSTATGLTYTNTTGVFSLTAGYIIPTTSQIISTLTTSGSSGASTYSAGTLNIPNYTFAGLSPLTTLGDIIYENATPSPARLPGNTTATLNILTQTGNGTISAAPSWGTLASLINTTNLQISAGVINTIQNINIGASPTFAGLSVGSGAIINIGGSGSTGEVIYVANSSNTSTIHAVNTGGSNAIYGVSTSISGFGGVGVNGSSTGSGGFGVNGSSTGSYGVGVYGSSTGSYGVGVYGTGTIYGGEFSGGAADIYLRNGTIISTNFNVTSGGQVGIGGTYTGASLNIGGSTSGGNGTSLYITDNSNSSVWAYIIGSGVSSIALLAVNNGATSGGIEAGGTTWDLDLQHSTISGIQASSSTTAALEWNASNFVVNYKTSSRKYKTNIIDIGDISSFIYDLRVVQYNPKDNLTNIEYGLIAEEVYLKRPDLVGLKVERIDLNGKPVIDNSGINPGEPELVYYSKLVTPMLTEVQKHEVKIKELNSVISELKDKISLLEGHLFNAR